MVSERPEQLAASYDLLIAGEFVEAESGERFTTENPATESALTHVARGDAADIDRAVSAAADAQVSWSSDPKARAAVLRNVADAIRDRTETIATVSTLHNGKPISESRAEVDVLAQYFDYYAGVADKIQGEQIPLTGDYVDFTIREPLGVTGHIVPWNFPVQIFGRGVAVSLAVGNATVVKPAEQTPVAALEIGRAALDAGLPPGLLNVVTGYGEEAGAALSGHENVDGVSFTGSVPAGIEVAKSAAENITPAHLELGGKSPVVVYPDADMENALDNTVGALFTVVGGQCCVAGSRLLVHEAVYDEYVDRLVSRLEDLDVGPGVEDSDLGPMIDDDQFEKVKRYLEVGRSEVGDPAYGGGIPDREGYFVEPTLFADVDNDTRIAQEEIFGPVLVATPFSSEAEAITTANDTDYGLGAGVFTSDLGRAMRFAREVEAGQVYVNEWFAGGVETPFGGYKKSGFGREKGLEAVSHFTQVKNVCANIDV